MEDTNHNAMHQHRHEGDAYRRIELITGTVRRRRWTAAEKSALVAESLQPEINVSALARQRGVSRGLLQTWRRAALRQSLVAGRDSCLLFDTPRLVMALEGLYRSMWQDYCRGQLPSPDLTNLSLYQEIGVDLALTARGDADLPDRYRLERERRRAFSFVAPDQRL